MMKKQITLAILFLSLVFTAVAQRKEGEEKGFRADNLFTGGSVSLGFSNNSVLLGASPIFGDNVTNWLDAGIVVNYNYSSYRNVYDYQDKLRQKTYGGGGFLKIYPAHFLFAQAQFEHNWITQKYIYSGGNMTEKTNADANSFLLGAGYSTGRMPKGNIFFSLSVLFDVMNDDYSPYKNSAGQTIPIIRGSIQVPLFQKR